MFRLYKTVMALNVMLHFQEILFFTIRQHVLLSYSFNPNNLKRHDPRFIVSSFYYCSPLQQRYTTQTKWLKDTFSPSSSAPGPAPSLRHLRVSAVTLRSEGVILLEEHNSSCRGKNLFSDTPTPASSTVTVPYTLAKPRGGRKSESSSFSLLYWVKDSEWEEVTWPDRNYFFFSTGSGWLNQLFISV